MKSEHWLKASEKAKTKTRTTATRLQETPEKRLMLEKDREARRNDVFGAPLYENSNFKQFSPKKA